MLDNQIKVYYIKDSDGAILGRANNDDDFINIVSEVFKAELLRRIESEHFNYEKSFDGLNEHLRNMRDLWEIADAISEALIFESVERLSALAGDLDFKIKIKVITLD